MAIPVAQIPKAYYYSTRRKQTQAPRRSSVGVSGGKEGKASEGGNQSAAGGLASREIINPDYLGSMRDGNQGPPTEEQMMPTRGLETQPIIPNQSNGPRFSIGNAANGHIDLGSLVSPRPNMNYDATKLVGGDNVPYKPTSGIGGWFRSVFGDDANARNLAVQRAQGADIVNAQQAAQAKADEQAAGDKAFGRQKELFNMQNDAANARQDALFAQQEGRDLLDAQTQLDRDALKIGADMEEAALRGSSQANKPASFEPGKIYPGENFGKPAGTLWTFEVNPLTGKSVMQEVGGKPELLTPPPKADGSVTQVDKPMELGASVEGVIPPQVIAGLNQLGQGIKRNVADTLPQLTNDAGAALFGGRVAANPTVLTRALKSPVKSTVDNFGAIPLGSSGLNLQGLAEMVGPALTMNQGTEAIPAKRPEQTTEDYIKMLRKLQGR